MIAGLVTLPLRLGLGATALVLRGVEEAGSRALATLQCAIGRARSTTDTHGPEIYPEQPPAFDETSAPFPLDADAPFPPDAAAPLPRDAAAPPPPPETAAPPPPPETATPPPPPDTAAAPPPPDTATTVPPRARRAPRRGSGNGVAPSAPQAERAVRPGAPETPELAEVPPELAPAPPIDEPEHVSEEPELVEELAEPGAEEGAGAQVTVLEPWDGYRRMNARDVVARLAAADPAELAAVELYERGHRNRRTVLAAVQRRLAG